MTHRRSGAMALGALGVAVTLAGACSPVDEPPGSPAPLNACPAHACSLYAQSPAPTCGPDGTCGTPVPDGVVLVASLPADGAFAPGLQFVVPYNHLGDSPDAACPWPACGHLSPPVSFQGYYVVGAGIQYPPSSTATSNGIGFFLGNADSTGAPLDTVLPVSASYRLLQDPWQTDVVALGLPVQPVIAVPFTQPPSPGSLLGPYGGAPTGYWVQLVLGTYERTVTPSPPYDAIFGPAVMPDPIPEQPANGVEVVTISSYDSTMDIAWDNPSSNAKLPSFNISRDAGLDGWTAYIRDDTTKEVLSNVRTLSGTNVSNVQLLTFHDPNEALTNAELVVAPPAGAPYPTNIFAGVSLPQNILCYPLPPPLRVTGAVAGPNGPVSAALVFEGLAFTDATGALNYSTFEFTSDTGAKVGPSGGPAGFDLTQGLPQGAYRVDVRPTDPSVASLVALATVDSQHTVQNFTLPAAAVVHGTATLKDGRLLSGALVAGVPVACVAVPDGSDLRLKPLGTTEGCLPRPNQVTTDDQGRFSLPLDPGGYLLRVQPAEGTGLPWLSKRIDVASDDIEVDPVVPAPIHMSFQLDDPADNPVARALVKAFYAPSATATSGAVELGEVLSDASGKVDLYMALPQ